MSRGITNLLVLPLLAVISACSGGGGDLHKCGEYMCTENDTIVKWQHSGVEFRFDTDVPENIREMLGQATQNYDSIFKDTTLLIDPANTNAPHYNNNAADLNQDGINSVYYVKGEWPWAKKIPGSLAVTLTRYSEDGLLEADIFIKENPVAIPDDQPDLQNYWLRYLCTHELGHAIGRAHSTHKESLMYPSMNVNQSIDLASQGSDDFFSDYDLQIFNLAYLVDFH